MKNYEDMTEHTSFIFYFPKNRTKVENTSVAKIHACVGDPLALCLVFQALPEGAEKGQTPGSHEDVPGRPGHWECL